ncbi:MAG: hypothetical protein ACI9XB_003764 [Gammaproteobacteria bacterium]|jgi:hypothetical protein
MSKSKFTLLLFLSLLLFLTLYSNIVFTQSFERQILASTDDAEEKFNGSNITTSSSDLELVYDSWNDQGLQTIGLRFDEIAIPSNSTILSAYIQFTADGDYSGDMTMTIKGEDSANSSPFSGSFSNISGRTQTTSSATWTSIPTWIDEQAGIAQRTPDLTELVTEVITSNGWQSNNPITFIITGSGNDAVLRKAYSFDENSTKAAKLYIEYESNTAVDLALVSCIAPTDNDYPNAASTVQVEITSFGNLTATDYTLAYSVDGNLITTEAGVALLEIAESVVFTFAETVDLSALGSYELSIELTINDDENPANNTFSKTITVIDEVDPLLFGQGSSWRYWDNSADPGSMWNAAGIDDSSWPVGVGHFGFGEGDEETALNGGLASYYFRKKVDIVDVSQLNSLYLNMIHDDGAIVYVNGQEVLRTEMMPLGTINHNTSARQSINDKIQNDFFTYKIDPSYFVSGENTIAISVRNRNAADGDLSFDCFISTGFLYDQDGPYVSYSGDDIIVEEVTPSGLVNNTYTTTDGLVLTCLLPHMGTSFSFTLKPEITIEPSVYESTPSKFLAISDFDGHIEGLTMVLRGEGIIDEEFNWTYGDGHLIISGDLFDRGFHITECMWLLYKLESEAEAAGGKLHLIIGNHEMFNLTDDWRYVEVKYFNDAHLMGKRMSNLYDADTELGRWLRSKNIIEEIGGHAFLHGGISPAVSALNLSYDQINEYGRLEMNGTSCPNSACTLVNSGDGIYWYRGMVDEELTQQEVDDILDGFGVGRVILGHTKDNTIRSLYEGRVIAIDMYHVNNFEDGFMEALQFELGCFYLFHTDGQEQEYTLLNDCDEITDNVLELNGDGQLHIYPNPASSTLNVEMPETLLGEYSYTILNMEGKKVGQGMINGERSTIGVEGYAAGKYVLTLRSSERVIAGHFILR